MESSGGRKFHKQFMYESKKASHECPNENDFDMLSYINRNILGKDQIFNGAFGDRKGKLILRSFSKCNDKKFSSEPFTK